MKPSLFLVIYLSVYFVRVGNSYLFIYLHIQYSQSTSALPACHETLSSHYHQ